MERLTPEDRRTLWEQFVEVYAHSQESYDSSIRGLAAGAVAVTVSLATALQALSTWGVAAVTAFLASLGLNLASYVTAQLDMRARLDSLRAGREDGTEGNRWTKATTGLNVIAGLTLIAGGVLLAIFVAKASEKGGETNGETQDAARQWPPRTSRQDADPQGADRQGADEAHRARTDSDSEGSSQEGEELAAQMWSDLWSETSDQTRPTQP